MKDDDLNFICIKGVSGCGKSTFANFIKQFLYSDEVAHFEADMWMVNENGEYEFSVDKLNYCHTQCKNSIEKAMQEKFRVVILSNTSTKQSSLRPYLDLCKKYNYKITSLCLENLHGNKDLHNLPEITLQKQERELRFSLKLR